MAFPACSGREGKFGAIFGKSSELSPGPKVLTKKIAAGTDNAQWDVAIGLCDRSRKFILRHCVEPDLA